jgi:hypothetical protein
MPYVIYPVLPKEAFRALDGPQMPPANEAAGDRRARTGDSGIA